VRYRGGRLTRNGSGGCAPANVAASYGWPADLNDEQILEKLLALHLARTAAEASVATAPRKSRPARKARRRTALIAP
jgi:hypothetical protein